MFLSSNWCCQNRSFCSKLHLVAMVLHWPVLDVPKSQKRSHWFRLMSSWNVSIDQTNDAIIRYTFLYYICVPLDEGVRVIYASDELSNRIEVLRLCESQTDNGNRIQIDRSQQNPRSQIPRRTAVRSGKVSISQHSRQRLSRKCSRPNSITDTSPNPESHLNPE